ncbi:YcaQ family DNA glycosylase [Streptomyces gardneri]|uniref:DNA glycosylase AlkZ-like family protein n=1 Tax=Nocardia abscessus TaxID=120957 RepID=UPI001893CB62|nr:crosslink repair DNA glycosylase YcaQ family protein [Nocardia abscessus]MBF6169204.1 YcaQ family DNA glycosylase [Streptomyces gardneri]MBF6475289.1 YcaQ family DNA glycosylase [Nocardia abscessus]
MPTNRCTELRSDEARSVALTAQLGSVWSDPLEVLRTQGIMQLDALTRIDKAHRLLCYARLAEHTDRIDVDQYLWSLGQAISFETYTHAACLLPIEDYPLLQDHRDKRATAAERIPAAVRRDILRIVTDTPNGAVIGDIESAAPKTSGWGWSERKTAVEQLLWAGELVVTSRRSSKRVYDLPQRRIPADILIPRLEPDQLNIARANRALRSLGIVTAADLARHYHIAEADARDGLANSDGIKVEVEGWHIEAWMDPNADQSARFELHTPRLIGPFDNLLRDRARARRLFGFDYVFEAYVPAAKRKYGHYVMAVVDQTGFIGRVDARRIKRNLEIANTFREPEVDPDRFDSCVEAACRRLAGHLDLDITRNGSTSIVS